MNVKGVIIFANVLGLLMSQVGFAREINECREFHPVLERLKDQYGLMPMARKGTTAEYSVGLILRILYGNVLVPIDESLLPLLILSYRREVQHYAVA